MLNTVVEDIEISKNLLIPLSDGVSLAANLFIPKGQGPFPTVVTYSPYQKDFSIGIELDYPCHYFAEHGYAVLVVDMRGFGNSEGVAWDTYDPREGDDGVQAIEWAAAQDWCDGNIGMWGYSYDGNTTLRVASRRPTALKAIGVMQTNCDVYRAVHKPFSCLPFFGLWGTMMTGLNITPPGYQDPEGRWFSVWKERLKHVRPPILAAAEHPTYDEHWQSRVTSAKEINVPTFVIGGWRDLLPNPVLEIYEEISAPKKMLFGPWTHIIPHAPPVEPWDIIFELKRWWDRWLKQEVNGVEDEPAVTMFVQGSEVWKHEAGWPIERTEEQTLFLQDHGALGDSAPQIGNAVSYLADPTVGVTAGLWDGTGAGIGLPIDQAPDDLRSLTFTSEPLNDGIEITGTPEVSLHVELNSGTDLNLVAKLSAVAEDGSSTLITTGSVQGSTYFSDEKPQALEQDTVYEFQFQMFSTSYFVPPAHRLRLSISCSDFPRLWPTAENPLIRLHWGEARSSNLRLPIVPEPAEPVRAPEIRRPDPAINPLPHAKDGMPKWDIHQDMIAGRVAVTTGGTSVMMMPAGGEARVDTTVTASVSASQPASARIDGRGLVALDLPTAGTVEIESASLLTPRGMVLRAKITMNGMAMFEKEWIA